MTGSKLLKLLAALSAEQFKGLKKAIASPLLTTNPNLQTLYTLLHKHHPKFSHPALAKRKVFTQLFPDHEYSDIKLRNLMRELTAVVEHYLVMEELEVQSFEKGKLLAAALGRLGLKNGAQKELQRIEKANLKAMYFDRHFHQQKLEMILQQLDLEASSEIRERLVLLHQARQQMDAFYHMYKAELDYEFQSFESVAVAILSQQKNSAPHHIYPWESDPAYRLYQQLIELRKSGSMKLFDKIKAEFTGQLSMIRKDNQQHILIHLINFIIRKMKENDAAFNPIAFSLYQMGIDKKILFQDNQLSANSFINITIASAKEKEFKWAQHFIKNHQSLLPEQSRVDVITLSNAYLQFHQGNFETSIDISANHTFSNPLQHISARVHAIRCYYELFEQKEKYFDLLISKAQAFEKFIRRNKFVLTQKKQAYVNFALFIQKMAHTKLSTKSNSTKKRELSLQLNAYPSISSRSWVSEKINSFKK